MEAAGTDETELDDVVYRCKVKDWILRFVEHHPAGVHHGFGKDVKA